MFVDVHDAFPPSKFIHTKSPLPLHQLFESPALTWLHIESNQIIHTRETISQILRHHFLTVAVLVNSTLRTCVNMLF